MSNIETYLRDMSHLMGENHEPVASRPYDEMWDTYLNTGKNVCIFSPRRSGKTYALSRKFLNTPNSCYITANVDLSREMKNWCRQQGFTRGDLDFNRDIYTHSTIYRLIGSRVENIFIDEIDTFRVPLQEINEHIQEPIARGARVTAVTTPTGRNDLWEYNEIFQCIHLPHDWVGNHTNETLEDYFDKELFEI